MKEVDGVRLLGMLYILVSFIPWIVYWILCGFGNPLGITASLIISIILILPQILKRSFNLMDLVSLIYFSLAFISTFILNLNIFLENSGFLGYLALFLMASFSIAIGQPYTLQVSKRDYPRVYWKDKSFLTINNIITAVWAGIFLLNSVIFLFLQFPLTAVLSNLFIAVDIFFSVVYHLVGASTFPGGGIEAVTISGIICAYDIYGWKTAKKR